MKAFRGRRRLVNHAQPGQLHALPIVTRPPASRCSGWPVLIEPGAIEAPSRARQSTGPASPISSAKASARDCRGQLDRPCCGIGRSSSSAAIAQRAQLPQQLCAARCPRRRARRPGSAARRAARGSRVRRHRSARSANGRSPMTLIELCQPLSPNPCDVVQPQPNAALLQRAARRAPWNVERQNRHAMALGVADRARREAKIPSAGCSAAHRKTRPDNSTSARPTGRRSPRTPRRGFSGRHSRQRRAAAQRPQWRSRWHTLRLRAGHKGIVQLRNRLLGALRPQRAPQLLALPRRKARQITRDFQHLLLEQDDAKGFFERRLQQRMCVGDWLQPLGAGADRDAPYRPGAGQGGSARSRRSGRSCSAA